MSRIFRSVCIVCFSFLSTTLFLSSLTLADPQVGVAAPAFSLVDTNGKKVSLSNYAGKTVVLEWTNHECPFVGKHYGSGNMQALQKEATSTGVVWLSIISSAPGRQGHVDARKANELTVERDASPSAVILDPEGKIGRVYNATATPNMFVINGKGILVYKGAIDDKPSANPADVKGASNYVRLTLEALAAGKPIAKPVTRPYGCSVKYGT